MPETPKITHVNDNSSVIDYNNSDYNYTLPESSLVTGNYNDDWYISSSGSESESESDTNAEADAAFYNEQIGPNNEFENN